MPAVNPHLLQAAKKKQVKVTLKRRYISDVLEVEEKPPPKPPKVHDSGVSEDVLNELTDAFELLYDPNYFGHLEFEDQLKKFKSRDLLEAKLYKTALKAFGNQRFVRERLAKDNGRKRVIVARPLSELRGFDSFSSAACLPGIRSDSAGRGADSSADAASEVEDPAKKELSRYQQWLTKRQTQHRDLEQMGDVERYLRGKGGQLTSMERAALKRIEDSRRPKAAEPVAEEVAETRARPDSNVSVKRPSPLALFIIDSELRKRKLRLSDLFTSIDKDKDWLLTRDEFRKAMRQNRVPLPEPLLEDMIITLDQDNNNQLDYRELAQGLVQYRRERRSPEFLALLSEESNQFLLARGSSGEARDSTAGGGGGDSDGADSPDSAAAESSVAASGRTPSPLLKPGEFDTSQERYSVNNAEASAELRRRDQVALQYVRRGRQRGQEFRSMVKTFDRDIDDHVTPSSLPEKPLAERVDAFRQRQLREFMAIVDACRERGVVFSERLCRRVFLYPADRTKKQIGDDVAPPGSNPGELPAGILLAPTQRASLAAAGGRRGVGDGASGGVGGGVGGALQPGAVGAGAFRGAGAAPWWRQNSGGANSVAGGGRATNMARLGRVLPHSRDLLVDDDDAEVELPTGTALVRRKVDCWLTFEEFQRFTDGLDYSGQAHLRGPRKDAFWPGRLEGRVRRYLDSGLDGAAAYGPKLLFQPTQPQRGSRSHPYLPRETWPVVAGHVTYGSIDPMLGHDITGPRRLQSKVAL